MTDFVVLVRFIDGWPAWQHVFNAGGYLAGWHWVIAPNRERAIGKVEAWFVGLGYDIEVVDTLTGYEFYTEFGTTEV